VENLIDYSRKAAKSFGVKSNGVLAWALIAFFGFLSCVRAETLSGFLVYAPVNDGDAPKVVPFSEIYWQSAKGGSITNLNGSSVAFENASVAQFVFLDEGSWNSIAHNSAFAPFRTGIVEKEVVVPDDRWTIDSDRAIAPFIKAAQALPPLIKAAPQYADTLTPILERLNGEVKHYQSGERKVGGKWVAAGGATNPTSPASGPSSQNLDITTVDGQIYKNVSHVTFDQNTVSFICDTGGATLDLAMLTPELQKRFNYDSKARSEQRMADEKTREDAEAAAQAVVLAEQKKADEDMHNYAVATSRSTLNGQVFIATQGGDNVKLGGVHVLLYSKAQMDLIVNPRKLEAIKQLTAINAELKKEYQEYETADAASANGDTINENGVYTDANQRKTKLMVSIAELKRQQETFLSPDYYLTNLPPPFADVQTDADGKFTMTMPVGEYVLAAKAQRTVFIEEKHYCWLVKFDMGSVTRSFQLSNENLTSGDSEDSLIVTQ
jgi:hypothetical protein